MSVMLSGWTEWQFNENWEPTTQNHLISSRPLASSVIMHGDVVFCYRMASYQLVCVNRKSFTNYKLPGL